MGFNGVACQPQVFTTETGGPAHPTTEEGPTEEGTTEEFGEGELPSNVSRPSTKGSKYRSYKLNQLL